MTELTFFGHLNKIRSETEKKPLVINETEQPWDSYVLDRVFVLQLGHVTSQLGDLRVFVRDSVDFAEPSREIAKDQLAQAPAEGMKSAKNDRKGKTSEKRVQTRKFDKDVLFQGCSKRT